MEKGQISITLKDLILESVIYQGSFNRDGNLTVSINDNIDMVDIGEKDVTFRFTRFAKTNNDLFNLTVKYLFKVSVSDESFEVLNKDVTKTIEYLKSKQANVVNDFGIASRASILISSITANTLNPLITPPSVVIKEQ